MVTLEQILEAQSQVNRMLEEFVKQDPAHDYRIPESRIELRQVESYQANAEPCSMDNAIAQAAGLLTDMDNEEYIRGMCELLASMFPAPDTGTEERAEWFTAEVEKKLNANNAATRARA